MRLSTSAPGSTSSLREHLKIAVPSHAWLQPFEMTPFETYIMAVFWQVNKDRPSGFNGAGPVSLSSLVHYQALFGDVLNTDEIHLIQHLDRVYMDTLAALREENNNG